MFYVDEDIIQLKNVCHISKNGTSTEDGELLMPGKLVLKTEQIQFYPDSEDESSITLLYLSEIHRYLISQRNSDCSIVDSSFKLEITQSSNLYFKIFLKTFKIVEFVVLETNLNKQSKKTACKFFKYAFKRTFGGFNETNGLSQQGSHPTKEFIHKRKAYTNSFFRKYCKSAAAKESSMCDLNHNYGEHFYAFPAYFLVPQGWYGTEVKSFSQIVDAYRGPVFCFAYPPTRHMLLRSASFTKFSHHSVQADKLKFCIQKINKNSDLQYWDLQSVLPTTSDLKEAFESLHKICLPESQSSFNDIDSHWLSKLEQCRWLEIIHMIFQTTKTIAMKLKLDSSRGGESIVIMERFGRDWTCLISSLVQLLFLPEFRTLKGFQDLLEKEWIFMGHNFPERNGLKNEKSNQTYLFTLFLDCVWQLTDQFPLEFEFSELYLFHLSDASFRPNSIEFGCGTEYERCSYMISMGSVWDWIHSQKYRSDFINPYFLFGKQFLKYTPKTEPLPLSSAIWRLKFWKTYYFRGNNFLDTGTSKEVEDFMKNPELFDELEDCSTVKSSSSTFYVSS